MYCKSCGHDEPEIKINNKLYCSNCGLVLGEEEKEAPSIVPEEKKQNELSNVFSTIGSSMEKSEGGSYRSKDFSVLEKPKITKHLSYESQKPVQEMIEKELHLDEPEEKEEVKNETTETKETLPQTAFEEPIVNEATEIKRGSYESLKEREEALLGDILKDEIPKNEEKKSEEKEVETLEEKPKEEKKALEESIKKVDELGAASKLIDILEEEGEKKIIEEKKKKLDGLGKAFGKLIDILNHPVESPKPKKQENHTTDDHIIEMLSSLQKTKEIESPLDTVEIEAPNLEEIDEDLVEQTEEKNDIKEEDESEFFPQVEPENTFQEPEKEIMPDELEEKAIPNLEPEEKKPKKLDKLDKYHKKDLEKLKKKEKKEIVIFEEENDEEENEIPPSEEELANIEKNIHGFGDKKGHIDHWPEEDVPRSDHNQHVLTSFLKTLTNQKKEQKEEKKEEKSNKNKVKRKVRISGIILVTFFTATIFASFYGLSQIQLSQKNEFDSSTIGFNIISPYYIPIGYEKGEITKISENSILIRYDHIADETKNIEFVQEKVENGITIDLEKYAKQNSTKFAMVEKSGTNYFLLDESKITWTEGDMWYILKKEGDLHKEELQLMAESTKK